MVMDGQTDEERILREKAREGIRSRRLPAKKAIRVYAGPGSEQPCAVCGGIISRADTGFQAEFTNDGVTSGFDNYYLHYRCFAAWEFERTKDGSVHS